MHIPSETLDMYGKLTECSTDKGKVGSHVCAYTRIDMRFPAIQNRKEGVSNTYCMYTIDISLMVEKFFNLNIIHIGPLLAHMSRQRSSEFAACV